MREMTPEVARIEYKVASFSGFDGMPDDTTSLGYCSYGYNILCENGMLTHGYGIDAPSLNSPAGRKLPDFALHGIAIGRMFLLKRVNDNAQREDALLGIGEDGKLMRSWLASGDFVDTGKRLSSNQYDAANCKLDGEDVLVLYLGTGGAYVFDGTELTLIPDTPALACVCQHYGRIFGAGSTQANTVWYSAPLNPLDFSPSLEGGGYIELDDIGGKIQKILSFNDNLYIFRDYAIYRLTAYMTPSDYKVVKVFECNEKINANTAVVAGSRILFATTEGLMTTDGYIVKPFQRNLRPLFADMTNAAAAYYGGKYYLSFRLINPDNNKVGDEILGDYKNNAMLTLDGESNDVAILRGADIKWFLSINAGENNGLYVGFGNWRRVYIGKISRSGKVFGTTLAKLWRSPMSNLLQLDKQKTVKRAFIRSPHPLRLKILADDRSKSIECGAYITQCLTYNLTGERIGFEISTDEDELDIRNLKIDINLNRKYL